jgi:very-short-patch-repair endonuclease
MARNARKDSRLDSLNIVDSCKVCKLEIDYATDKAKLVTIDTCLHTPKAIGDCFRKHGIAPSGWVLGISGRELWVLDNKSGLAHQAKG